MANYRTRAQINWQEPVVIQMATTGTQLSDTLQPDTNLVLENGIWKFPRIAGNTGAVVVPPYGGTQPTGPVRLAAWQGAFTTSTSWELWLRGNTNNTSEEPYPSGDAPLYAEPNQILASATGALNISASYGLNGSGVGAPIIMPGQGVYFVTTGATNPFVRLFFTPLMRQGGIS
jgi:hypothetical protein